MCGNSICQDRRFLANYMPELEAFFHYRNLDVSTLKELARRWKPGDPGRLQEGAGAHRAGRHPRVDRRAAALPRALAGLLTAPCRRSQALAGKPRVALRIAGFAVDAATSRPRGDSFIPSDLIESSRERRAVRPVRTRLAAGMVGGDAVALTVPVSVRPSPSVLVRTFSPATCSVSARACWRRCCARRRSPWRARRRV